MHNELPRSHRSAGRRPALAVVLVVALLLAASPGIAGAGLQPLGWGKTAAPTLMSASPTGALADEDTFPGGISDDGRVVVMDSYAGNLSAEDTNTAEDVYIRDISSPVCSLVSVTPSTAVLTDDWAGRATISDDGRYVVFETMRDLVPTDTNRDNDYYVKDMVTGTYTLMDAVGDGSAFYTSQAAISGNGRYVVFDTNVDISVEDTSSRNDVYRWDRESGETTYVGAPNEVSFESGTEYRGARGGVISDDGRYVGFFTGKSLVASDTNGGQDLYVKDLQTGEYTWANLMGTGESPGNSGVDDLVMSGDGRYLVFQSDVKLVDADLNGDVSDVYMWDRESGETTLVSAPRAGATQWNRGARSASISDDGRYVALFTGQDLVASDTNNMQDLYLKDFATGAIQRIVASPGDLPQGRDVYDIMISGDGSALVYELGGVTGRNNQTYRVQLFPTLTPGSVRLEGTTRYLTAVDVSKDTFPNGAANVVIATGEKFPDALCASALAGALGGPILLTKPDALPSEVKAELTRLGAQNAYIVGGTPSVSAAVENELGGMLSGHVNRIFGSDRYRTSEAVANRVVEMLGTGYGHDAFVATGKNFPDAVAAAPLAAGLDRPILLVNPSSGAVYVPAETARVAVLGSTETVPANVEDALQTKLGDANVTRIAGANRYATAALIAEYGVANGLIWDGVAIANGEKFPDALSGGASIGLRRGVMLLTPADSLAPAASDALTDNAAAISSVTFLGSADAVSADVQTEVETILGF